MEAQPSLRTIMAKERISAVVTAMLLASMALAVDFNQPANTWVKRSPLPGGPPVPRLGYEGACAWDASRNLFIRYGGHNQGGGGAQYSEIWTWDPFSSKWTLKEPNTSPPGVCCAQQNVFDPISKRYVRFEAFSGNHGWQWFREIYLNNSTIWTYDPDTNLWKNMRPLPAPRVSGLRCASYDSDAQVIVVFGGEGNHEGTVVYDPYGNCWTRMKPPIEPEFRSAGNMVYDCLHKRHILFGSQFSDDRHTWSYDLRANRWTDMKPPTLPPTKENDAVMAYDRANGVVIAIVKITEGEGENARHQLQTWTFDAGTNRWTRMNPPHEPDATGNRSRVLVCADALGMAMLENRTRSQPGPPEQQMWTYCYKSVKSDPDAVAAPKDVKLTTTTDAVTLSWRADESKGVTGYIVYRGAGEHPWTVDYKKTAELDADATTFEDTDINAGTLYYYCIAAVAGSRRSPMSVKVRTQPSIVEDVVVSALSNKEVLVQWTAPKVADITGYRIERAPVEVWTDDQLNRLKSKVAPLPQPSVGAIRKVGAFETITQSPLKETSFRDRLDLSKPVAATGEPSYTSPLGGDHLDRTGADYRYAVYAYRVRAINALAVESGPSPCVFTIPSSPQWVFSRKDGKTCRLKWKANPEKAVTGYRVYRMDGRWESDSISRLTPQPITATQWTDEAAGDPIRRYYVVAVDVLGQESMPSAPVWYNREWRQFYEPFTGPWHQ